jgi:uridine kinase
MKVILISGPSCSGKSTLAQKLATELTGEILSVDMFYKSGGEKFYVQHQGERIRTYERKESYEGKRVAQIIKELHEKDQVTYDAINFTTKKTETYTIKQNEYILVEGFHTLNYPSLITLATTSIYLDLPFEQQLARRKLRGGRVNSNTTFEKIGQQEYEQYVLPQKEIADLVLDATESTEELIKKALHHVL